MLRMVSAVLVSGPLVLGAVNAVSAQEYERAPPVRSEPALKAPLAPGGAAGIKQAQAQRSGIRNFIPLGIVTGLALLVVLTGGDDDDDDRNELGKQPCARGRRTFANGVLRPRLS